MHPNLARENYHTSSLRKKNLKKVIFYAVPVKLLASYIYSQFLILCVKVGRTKNDSFKLNADNFRLFAKNFTRLNR